MKKLSTLVILMLSMLIAAPISNAQSLTKQQKAANKAAKKEARALKKEGWMVPPGTLTMDLQLQESYSKALEKDEKGFEKYIAGEAMSIGETFDAALFQASNLAKLDLAGKIQTDITQLIDNKLANNQLSQQQAASLVKSVSASKNLVSQKIGRVINPVKMYRILDNGNVEVRTVVYYSHELAMDAMKQALRESLESEADEMAKQLDQLLGF